MNERETRRRLEVGLLLCFLLFGLSALVWGQWQLDWSFARRDPSRLTIPFAPLPI